MLRLENGDFPKENACDCWHPPECSCQQKRNGKLGNKCAFTHTEKAGGEPKKRNNSVVVAKTLDHNETGKVTSLRSRAKGELLHRVSDPSEINFSKVGEIIVIQFRLSRVAARFVKELQKKGQTLGNVQQSGEHVRSPNAPSYEQFGSCANLTEANMEFARKKAKELHKHIYKV